MSGDWARTSSAVVFGLKTALAEITLAEVPEREVVDSVN